MLNEFFLYVLEDVHTTQDLGALQFTSADPAFVKETVERFYPVIPATATAPEMPATRAFSAAHCLHCGLALARPTRPPPPAPAPPPAARGAPAALGLRRQRVPLHRQRRTTRELQTSSRGRAATRVPLHRQRRTTRELQTSSRGRAATIRCCHQP